jgi:hypothetical protein
MCPIKAVTSEEEKNTVFGMSCACLWCKNPTYRTIAEHPNIKTHNVKSISMSQDRIMSILAMLHANKNENPCT